MWLMATVLIAVMGGVIGIKCRIPAGAMIGSMAVCAVFNIVSGNLVFPQEFKFVTQLCTGAYIGTKIRKQDIYELKDIIKPAAILSICMCIFNIVISLYLSYFTEIDLVTALFATAPAGITDMTIISADYGADSPLVALLQLVRLLSVVSIMPHLIKTVDKRVKKQMSEETQNIKSVQHQKIKKGGKELGITLSVAAVFGTVGFLIGIPAGTISFSMIGSAFYNIKTNRAYMPITLRQCVQFFAGALIGGRITMNEVQSMWKMLPAIGIIVVGFIVLNIVAAVIMIRFSKFDLITALFSSAAGGLTDMSIIAAEMGADAPKVAAMQLIRVVSVIMFYPIIIKLILNLTA